MNPDTDALRTLFASPFSPGKWTEVLAGLFGVRHAADGQLLERPRPVAVPDADGFFAVRRSGVLRAKILYTDGTSETLLKEINVR